VLCRVCIGLCKRCDRYVPLCGISCALVFHA